MAVQHIIPLNDSEPHTEDRKAVRGIYIYTCKCDPRLEDDYNGGYIVVHNSFDGREGIEMFKDILSKSKPFSSD